MPALPSDVNLMNNMAGLCFTLSARFDTGPCSIEYAINWEHIAGLRLDLRRVDYKIPFKKFVDLRANMNVTHLLNYPTEPVDHRFIVDSLVRSIDYGEFSWLGSMVQFSSIEPSSIVDIPEFYRAGNEIKIRWIEQNLNSNTENIRHLMRSNVLKIRRYLLRENCVISIKYPNRLNVYGKTHLPALPVLLAISQYNQFYQILGISRYSTITNTVMPISINNWHNRFFTGIVQQGWGAFWDYQTGNLVFKSGVANSSTIRENPSNLSQPPQSPNRRPHMSQRKSELWELKSYSFDFFAWSDKQILVSSPAEVDEPIYGVELEVSSDHTVKQVVEALEPVWVCAKSDGSITGSKRYLYELVTLPMSYKMHKMMWAKWFNKLGTDKFDTSRATTNGMHVHISRDSFNNKRHMRDFAWFFTSPYSAKFVIDFSERGELNNYCPLPTFDPMCTKLYIRKNIMAYLSNLRGVVNTKKAATIEVRLFKGIVSYATVLKNLELVDAVFKWSGEGVSYTANPLESFLSWLTAHCKKHPNKYEALNDFLKTMPLDDCLSASKAIYTVQGAHTREVALEALRGCHGLNDAAVEALNTYYGANYFRWDYKLDCITLRPLYGALPNHGMIAHLDDKFLKKYNRTPRAAA